MNVENLEQDHIVALRESITELWVDWSDKRLATITRLRFLTDYGCPFMDLSYCYGVLKDGTGVHVQVPFYQLNKRTWKTDIIRAAKADGVYAKGLGLFDAISIFGN